VITINKCIFIGNLTKEPEGRTTPNGVAVTTFTIAVNRRFKDQNGEAQTDYINIVTWRATAENCAKYLTKGSKVAIVGALQNRSYEAQDGTKRYITEIIADEVQFLNTKTARSDRTGIRERRL